MSKLLNIKKLICLIGILGFSINSVIASEIINLAKASERPVWQELCPQGLENAQYKDIKWFWPDGTKATQEIYNYWAKRRADFEDSLAECEFMTDEFKSACYANVKSKQLFDTELYNTDKQKKQISRQVGKESFYKNTSSIMIDILPK